MTRYDKNTHFMAVLEARQIQCDKFHLGLMNGWWSLVRWMYRCFPGEVWFFSEDNCQARKLDQIWNYILFPWHAHRLWKLLFVTNVSLMFCHSIFYLPARFSNILGIAVPALNFVNHPSFFIGSSCVFEAAELITEFSNWFVCHLHIVFAENLPQPFRCSGDVWNRNIWAFFCFSFAVVLAAVSEFSEFFPRSLFDFLDHSFGVPIVLEDVRDMIDFMLFGLPIT